MINIIGQFFGTSGYASHTRYLANALNKIEKVRILTSLPPNWTSLVNDEELTMIKRGEQESYDTNLVITHPVHWKSNCWAKKNIVYLVWEGDQVPKWILQECYNKNIDNIIVPSMHTKEALFQGNRAFADDDEYMSDTLKDKVVLIPHGVDLDIFKPIDITRNDTFKFLANKGFRNLEDRGGIQYLIRAFAEEFKPDENVELILKINTAYGIPNIQGMFPELSKSAPIKVIASELTPEALNKLYNECDVFVSPTRAEAFNIPCLEALACGKPVITTGYGGQTDFIDSEVGILTDFNLTQVEHEIEYEGVKWATPDIKHLQDNLRHAFKGMIQKPSSCRVQAERYSWDNTAKKIKELI